MTHHTETDDAGLPDLHQGHARGDLGRDHQAGVHDEVLLRRRDRVDAASPAAATLGAERRAVCDDEVRVRPAAAARHGWRSLYDPELAGEPRAG